MEYIYNPQANQDEQFQVVMQWHIDQQQQIDLLIDKTATKLGFKNVPAVNEMFQQNARFKVISECLPDVGEKVCELIRINQFQEIKPINTEKIKKYIKDSINWLSYEEIYINTVLEQMVEYVKKFGFQETYQEIEKFYETNYEDAFNDLGNNNIQLRQALEKHLSNEQIEDLNIVANEAFESWMAKYALDNQILKLFEIDRDKIVKEMANLGITLTTRGVADVINSVEYQTDLKQYLNALTETVKNCATYCFLHRLAYAKCPPTTYEKIQTNLQNLQQHLKECIKYLKGEISFEQLVKVVWPK